MKKSKQVFLFFRHLLNNLMNQNFFGFEKVKHLEGSKFPLFFKNFY